METKNYFISLSFLIITPFEARFTSFFKDKKSKRSHKTGGIKSYLTIFAWWVKDPESGPEPDPEPDPYLVEMDPDPEGSKTYKKDSDSQHCFSRKKGSSVVIALR
jgi:hypothetical protein